MSGTFFLLGLSIDDSGAGAKTNHPRVRVACVVPMMMYLIYMRGNLADCPITCTKSMLVTVSIHDRQAANKDYLNKFDIRYDESVRGRAVTE